MTEPIVIALISAGSAAAASLLTYAGTRGNLRITRENNAASSKKELGTAELSYMGKLQEMLVTAGQTLLKAEEEHHQKELILERGKYVAEETLKRAEADHERTIREERRFSSEQNDEIILLQSKMEVLHVRIRDLEKQLGFLGTHTGKV